jgi:hypothetical protein
MRREILKRRTRRLLACYPPAYRSKSANVRCQLS